MVLKICPLESFNSTEELVMSLNPHLSKTASRKLIKKHKMAQKSWQEKAEVHLPIEIVNHGLINPVYTGSRVEILQEDANWIAVNKPIRVHTHPLDYKCQNNLLSSLIMMKKNEAALVNNLHYDRGALYRLDFETSGIVILAKNKEFHEYIRENFHLVSRTKKYLAIVNGEMSSLGEQVHYMKPSLKKNSKMIEGEKDDFQAILTIDNIEYNQLKNQSLVHIRLQTGHRHQIRYQLSHLGFPIIGDELYGGAEADRLYLHALEYEFDLGEQKLCLKTGIPKEFEL